MNRDEIKKNDYRVRLVDAYLDCDWLDTTNPSALWVLGGTTLVKRGEAS